MEGIPYAMEGLSSLTSSASVLTAVKSTTITGCARIGSWGRVGDITTCLPN